tara:strand:- start:2591 stop:3802 length:1212 start_codon:yes stop_codon:yes gene_type:complete
MLSQSDTPIAEALTRFADNGLEISFLVPTPTGMDKSIMDATQSVRRYLDNHNFHRYRDQLQGTSNKVVNKAYFVFPDKMQETQVSLYRPSTKDGDPRIWFYKLREYANPYNLIGILVYEENIYVINCSNSEIMDSAYDPQTPFGTIVANLKFGPNDVQAELIKKLREISSFGYIPTIIPGDTGIGMTLERQLGITVNTSRGPDYKGIEIKAKRVGTDKVPRTRVTLFSQVPNWTLSPIGSAWNILSQYGYRDAQNKLRLSHQIDAVKPNSIGFVLEVDSANGLLKQNYLGTENVTPIHLATWELDNLHERLSVKHQETLWVNALTRGHGRNEAFHYIEAKHTKAPIIPNFDILLEAGVVSLDYTMSARSEERKTVRDHGYLFKIHPDNISALFSQPTTINLTK